MPEDLEVGIRFNTDQAIQDLENDLEDANLEAPTGTQGTSGGAAGGGDGFGLEGGLTAAEFGSDAATGPGGGGIAGQLAGGISKAVVLLGAVVGFLALLEPVQQALSFIVRQFELAVIPLIVALRPILELIQKFAVQIIKLLRNPTQFISGIIQGITKALKPVANAIIGGLNQLPFVNLSPVTTGQTQTRTTGFRSSGSGTNEIEESARNVATASLGFNFANAIQTGALEYFNLSDDGKVEKSQNQDNKGSNLLE